MSTPWATDVSPMDPAKQFATDIMKMAASQRYNDVDIIMAMVFILGFMVDRVKDEKNREAMIKNILEALEALVE